MIQQQFRNPDPAVSACADNFNDLHSNLRSHWLIIRLI
jgi:hypothetical protein